MFQGYHLNYMCQCVISRRNSNIPVHIYSRSFLYIKQYNFTNLIPVSSMSHILTSMLMLLLLLLITTMKMMMSMMMMTTMKMLLVLLLLLMMTMMMWLLYLVLDI